MEKKEKVIIILHTSKVISNAANDKAALVLGRNKKTEAALFLRGQHHIDRRGDNRGRVGGSTFSIFCLFFLSFFVFFFKKKVTQPHLPSMSSVFFEKKKEL